MICVAISDKDLRNCIALLQNIDMAEIRLDLTGFNFEEIDMVFAQSVPLIATCRPEKLGLDKQFALLSRAIQAGANYVDIEFEAPENHKNRIIQIAKEKKCKVIISYHNFEKTPGLKELYTIVDDCYTKGADIAKVATMVNSGNDNARIMSLYSIGKPLVAIGMGVLGKVTRLAAPLFGAEFTFAAMDSGMETAPGQIKYSEMKKLISEINKVLD